MSRRIQSYVYIRISNNADAFRKNFVGENQGVLFGVIENPLNRNRDFGEKKGEDDVFYHLGNIPQEKINQIDALVGKGNWDYV